MLDNAVLKVSPNGSFKVSQLCKSVVICEAPKDPHGWDNATDTEPAFIVYLGCHSGEVSGYVQTFNRFYRCEWCEVRKPKYLKGFEAEIKIRGMQRYSDSHAFGLDYLVEPQIERTSKGQLILNYYQLEFAYPDSNGQLTDEEGVYLNIRSLSLPFPNTPSHEDVENLLMGLYGPVKLVAIQLRQKIDWDGNILWQHPCVANEPEF